MLGKRRWIKKLDAWAFQRKKILRHPVSSKGVLLFLILTCYMSAKWLIYFDLFKVCKMAITFFWLVKSQEKCIVKILAKVKSLIQNQKQILALPLVQCLILILNLVLTQILVQCLWIWTSVFSLFCICTLLNKPADNFSFPFS